MTESDNTLTSPQPTRARLGTSVFVRCARLVSFIGALPWKVFIHEIFGEDALIQRVAIVEQSDEACRPWWPFIEDSALNVRGHVVAALRAVLGTDKLHTLLYLPRTRLLSRRI